MDNNFDKFTDADMSELRGIFYSHANEIAEDLQELALRLETDQSDENVLKTIRRHVHTLKGDANSMGVTTVGNLCHRMEDILSSSANEFDHKVFDLFGDCVEEIQRLLGESQDGGQEKESGVLLKRIDDLLASRKDMGIRIVHRPVTEYQDLEIREAIGNGLHVFRMTVGFHPLCREKNVAAFMVSRKLESIGHIISSEPDIEDPAMEVSKEMTFIFTTTAAKDDIERSTSITGITGEIRLTEYHGENGTERTATAVKTEKFAPEQKNTLMRVEVAKIDKVMNLVGELIIERSMIEQAARDLAGDNHSGPSAVLASVTSSMEQTLSELQKSVMKMRMVQVNHVFRKFPKTVRDLSAEKGKKIRLEIQGRETELDKGIVDALGEPLSHIIRNLVDHGIEDPSYRRAAGKEEEGVITLKAYHEAAQIVIEAADDGRGIDTDKLIKKAVEKDLVVAEEADRLSQYEALSLIFLPGLSTSETVSDTSGRGVGMDAVRTAVEAMKGSIEVESVTGKGTKFIMRLPLTLAVIKGLLFEVSGRLYALAVSAVAEVSKIVPENLMSVDGKTTLLLRDRVTSMIDLRELFGYSEVDQENKFALLLGAGSRRTGFIADRIVGQQELVIKAVDNRYTQSGLVSGASILGDGRIVLILDAMALLKKAVQNEKERLIQ